MCSSHGASRAPAPAGDVLVTLLLYPADLESHLAARSPPATELAPPPPLSVDTAQEPLRPLQLSVEQFAAVLGAPALDAVRTALEREHIGVDHRADATPAAHHHARAAPRRSCGPSEGARSSWGEAASSEASSDTCGSSTHSSASSATSSATDGSDYEMPELKAAEVADRIDQPQRKAIIIHDGSNHYSYPVIDDWRRGGVPRVDGVDSKTAGQPGGGRNSARSCSRPASTSTACCSRNRLKEGPAIIRDLSTALPLATVANSIPIQVQAHDAGVLRFWSTLRLDPRLVTARLPAHPHAMRWQSVPRSSSQAACTWQGPLPGSRHAGLDLPNVLGLEKAARRSSRRSSMAATLLEPSRGARLGEATDEQRCARTPAAVVDTDGLSMVRTPSAADASAPTQGGGGLANMGADAPPGAPVLVASTYAHLQQAGLRSSVPVAVLEAFCPLEPLGILTGGAAIESELRSELTDRDSARNARPPFGECVREPDAVEAAPGKMSRVGDSACFRDQKVAREGTCSGGEEAAAHRLRTSWQPSGWAGSQLRATHASVAAFTRASSAGPFTHSGVRTCPTPPPDGTCASSRSAACVGGSFARTAVTLDRAEAGAVQAFCRAVADAVQARSAHGRAAQSHGDHTGGLLAADDRPPTARTGPRHERCRSASVRPHRTVLQVDSPPVRSWSALYVHAKDATNIRCQRSTKPESLFGDGGRGTEPSASAPGNGRGDQGRPKRSAAKQGSRWGMVRRFLPTAVSLCQEPGDLSGGDPELADEMLEQRVAEDVEIDALPMALQHRLRVSAVMHRYRPPQLADNGNVHRLRAGCSTIVHEDVSLAEQRQVARLQTHRLPPSGALAAPEPPPTADPTPPHAPRASTALRRAHTAGALPRRRPCRSDSAVPPSRPPSSERSRSFRQRIISGTQAAPEPGSSRRTPAARRSSARFAASGAPACTQLVDAAACIPRGGEASAFSTPARRLRRVSWSSTALAPGLETLNCPMPAAPADEAGGVDVDFDAAAAEAACWALGRDVAAPAPGSTADAPRPLSTWKAACDPPPSASAQMCGGEAPLPGEGQYFRTLDVHLLRVAPAIPKRAARVEQASCAAADARTSPSAACSAHPERDGAGCTSGNANVGHGRLYPFSLAAARMARGAGSTRAKAAAPRTQGVADDELGGGAGKAGRGGWEWASPWLVAREGAVVHSAKRSAQRRLDRLVRLRLNTAESTLTRGES